MLCARIPLVLTLASLSRPTIFTVLTAPKMFDMLYFAHTVWCDFFWLFWPNRILAEMYWVHGEYTMWLYRYINYNPVEAFAVEHRDQLATGRVARFIQDVERSRRAAALCRGYNRYELMRMFKCAMAARLERILLYTARHRYLTRVCGVTLYNPLVPGQYCFPGGSYSIIDLEFSYPRSPMFGRAVLAELPIARTRDTATLTWAEYRRSNTAEDVTSGPDIEVQTWDHQVFWMEREIEALDVD